LVIEGLPTELYQSNIPWHFSFGSIFVALYILSITWVAPRFGIANAVSIVLLGQLVSMCLIDHYGIIGAPQYSLNIQRLHGLLLMIAGVFLVIGRVKT